MVEPEKTIKNKNKSKPAQYLVQTGAKIWVQGSQREGDSKAQSRENEPGPPLLPHEQLCSLATSDTAIHGFSDSYLAILSVHVAAFHHHCVCGNSSWPFASPVAAMYLKSRKKVDTINEQGLGEGLLGEGLLAMAYLCLGLPMTSIVATQITSWFISGFHLCFRQGDGQIWIDNHI